MPTITFTQAQIEIIKEALNKRKPKPLAKGCRCPSCGFKTMANYCRECGQAIKPDVNKMAKKYIVYDEKGNIAFSGGKGDVCAFVGCSLGSFSNERFRSKPINGFRVVEAKE